MTDAVSAQYDVGDIAVLTAVATRSDDAGEPIDFDQEACEVTCHVDVSNGDAVDLDTTFVSAEGARGTYIAELPIQVAGATYWASWASVGDPTWAERQTIYSRRAVLPL